MDIEYIQAVVDGIPVNAGPVLKFHEPIPPLRCTVRDLPDPDGIIKIHTLEEVWMAHPSRRYDERWWKFGTTHFKPRNPDLRPRAQLPVEDPAYRY